MFHPGKVTRVIKNDDKTVLGATHSVLALVHMWDENLLTLATESGLGEKIKVGDVVLVDYDPLHPSLPVPRQVISKLLRGEIAKALWTEYLDRNQKRKSEFAEPAPLSGHTVR